MILENGTEFVSSGLARHLEGCDALLLFGATLGARVDTALRRISIRSIAEGAAAQAVASSLIESYLDQQEILWKEDLPDTWQYRSRFSPGYGDWDLGEQQKIFRLLNCPKTIGLTLTAGASWPHQKRHGGDRHRPERERAPGNGNGPLREENKCAACGNVDCPFRQEES